RETLRAYPLLAENDSAPYFAQVLGHLTASALDEAAAYRLIPVADLGYRAVSIPGGTILAGGELLASLEDEAMLAFVLAREIAHQESGRTLRRYRSRRASWALLARLEWGLGVLTRGTLRIGGGDVWVVR